MSNIISLKNYKTIKECRSLFQGYGRRVAEMNKEELLAEFARYTKEATNFPNHLLTLVKGEILLANLERVATTPEMKKYIFEEQARIKGKYEARLQET